jgi:gliding-associated putative ABC transporter substrate-binding component GldG
VDYNQRTTYAGQAISPDIRVMLILDPKQPFSERDKYELDQYLIRGGRILLLLNYQEVDLDVYNKQATLTRLRELNLDDFLMQYGLRLNYDLIQDRECEKTELFQPGPGGGSFVPRPWPFYPLLLSLPEHPFTRNADAVLLRYASSIDTLPRPGSRRSVFLQTSARSRTLPGSQYIEVNQVVGQPIPDALFNRPGLIAGALSEGSFLSLFNGRAAPTDSFAPQPPTATFGPQNHPDYLGAIALISDASFAQGKRFRDQTGYIPYDNKTVISNAVDYLAGDDVLLGIRAKKVQLRPLDKQKARDHALTLRLANLLGPVLLLALAGLGRYLWRRRAFGQAGS